jgi:RNA polymerase subunit RPABC4/transcription elongation factor Spt4
MTNRIIDKATHCEGCQKEFGNDLKYHSRNRCNPCYQKAYLDERYAAKRKVSKIKNCNECNVEFGSLNKKGKVIKKGSRGYCRPCYMRMRGQVATRTCTGCGNEMASKRLSLCPVCKSQEISSKKWKRKVRPPHIVDAETFELIRRLLVRYKVGHNNYADAFRVADVYMDIADNSNLLDNLREDYQIVEMLKWLKQTFDYNLQLLIKKRQAEAEQAEKKRLKLERKLKYFKFDKKEEKI